MEFPTSLNAAPIPSSALPAAPQVATVIIFPSFKYLLSELSIFYPS